MLIMHCIFYTSGAGSVESYFVDCGLRFGFQRGVVAAARRRVAFIYLTERFGLLLWERARGFRASSPHNAPRDLIFLVCAQQEYKLADVESRRAQAD
jgi:hypothetical protein